MALATALGSRWFELETTHQAFWSVVLLCLSVLDMFCIQTRNLHSPLGDQ
jgi:hypothetical protein